MNSDSYTSSTDNITDIESNNNHNTLSLPPLIPATDSDNDEDIDIKEENQYNTDDNNNNNNNETETKQINHSIFIIEIIKHSSKIFGRTKRSKKKHPVSETYTLGRDVKITQNVKNKIFSLKVPVDQYTLSSDAFCTAEICLKANEDIGATSKPFEIPHKEKLSFKDNGIFCCCGQVYEKGQQYLYNQQPSSSPSTHENEQIIDEIQENDAIDRIPIRRNNIYNNNNKSFKMKIIDDEVKISDGALEMKFKIDGFDYDEYMLEQDLDEDEDEHDETRWMLCDGPCKTWQHVACLGWDIKTYRDRADHNLYFCPLLCNTKHFGTNLTSAELRYLFVVKNIGKLYTYKRSKDAVKYRGIYGEYMKWRKQELINLGYHIGLFIDIEKQNLTKYKIAEKIMDANRFTQTPSKVARYMASIKKSIIGTLDDENDTLRIADLGCGNGHITVQLAESYPNAIIDAFDSNADRICCARKLYADKYKNINWICTNILEDLDFIETYITNGIGYDLIYSNPPFEKGFEFIYCGLQLLKHKKSKSSLVFLLPQPFFNGSPGRIRLAKILNYFTITESHNIGAWNYYMDYDRDGNEMTRTGTKNTTDSIWVLKPIGKQQQRISHSCHDIDKSHETDINRFVYTTINPKLNGDL